MPAPALANATRLDPADEDLMLDYAAGDAAAFDTLYERHKGGVYRYLVRQCGNAGTADELFQDVWMNVIRSRATYVPSAKFTTWLYRIAHHRLIDHWRQAGHVALVSAGPDDDADDPLDALSAAADDEPEARATTRELSSRLKAACAAR
jgi:RNA polymerase sigma-70 factor (ECF subfamily)